MEYGVFSLVWWKFIKEWVERKEIYSLLLYYYNIHILFFFYFFLKITFTFFNWYFNSILLKKWMLERNASSPFLFLPTKLPNRRMDEIFLKTFFQYIPFHSFLPSKRTEKDDHITIVTNKHCPTQQCKQTKIFGFTCP